MKQWVFRFSVIIIILIVLGWVLPCAALKEAVCFRHVVTDRVKTDCLKLKGKHDAFPTYKCFDTEKKDYIDFEPKEYEWEELTGDSPECCPLPPDPKPRDLPKGGTNDKEKKGGAKNEP